MTYNSIVLVKQVPDTRTVTGDVMSKKGTMNRSAMPAIFNPEDLNALEMALQVRERYGGQITVLTMGPLKAADILRDALFHGADNVILLSDRKFAGADTQATAYTLKSAIQKIGDFDLIFCGRQAIDGDTAQVGPQVAEKLNLPQITYTESIASMDGDEIIAKRAFDLGSEIVKCKLPCLLTVVGSADRIRPASARKRIENKLAAIPSEYPAIVEKWAEFETETALAAYLTERNLEITVWTAADLDVNEDQLGLSGSPTQVYKVNYVVLESTESKEVPPTKEGIRELIQELIQEYIVG
ncbi:MAG: electron transfer flavoprotein subunit beta/FixA family protein [Anaerolineales bacterium]|nr:electron transfer flavoprotein subunit beta/FixA family protein [Chloroflexota bacterium]MBL6981233.1 electron transfer flavoprotein subunit beta/FixA family protein [Anaerolineales bacterium]